MYSSSVWSAECLPKSLSCQLGSTHGIIEEAGQSVENARSVRGRALSVIHAPANGWYGLTNPWSHTPRLGHQRTGWHSRPRGYSARRDSPQVVIVSTHVGVVEAVRAQATGCGQLLFLVAYCGLTLIRTPNLLALNEEYSCSPPPR